MPTKFEHTIRLLHALTRGVQSRADDEAELERFINRGIRRLKRLNVEPLPPAERAASIVDYLKLQGYRGDELKKAVREVGQHLQQWNVTLAVGGPMIGCCCRAAMHHDLMQLCEQMLTM